MKVHEERVRWSSRWVERDVEIVLQVVGPYLARDPRPLADVKHTPASAEHKAEMDSSRTLHLGRKRVERGEVVRLEVEMGVDIDSCRERPLPRRRRATR